MKQVHIKILQQYQNPYEGFQPIQQNAQKFYQEQLLPSIAERFNMTGGALTSPAFHSQAHQGAQSLTENLAGMQSQYGLQNRDQALRALGMGLTQQNENFPMSSQPGLMQSPGFWKGLAGLGVGLGTGFFLGPQAGFQAGYSTYNALGGNQQGYDKSSELIGNAYNAYRGGQ